MARMRRSDCARPGITRRRAGRGFAYYAPDGARVEELVERKRIDALTIPPAWRDVWICPDPYGHLQATGTDAAGRKQYLYHPVWRARQDQRKFDDMVAFAHALPGLRERIDVDLAGGKLDRGAVLACAVRLLDVGFFRIGSEDYAAQNESYGLATMRKEHVQLAPGDVIMFDFVAKHGKRRMQSIVDPKAFEVVSRLKRRRSGGPELLAYKDRAVCATCARLTSTRT